MSIFQKAADKIDSVKNNMANTLQDKYYTIYQDICIPQPRSIYDFLSTNSFSSGFGLPDFKDAKRWNNRIQKNLIYYQIGVIAPVIVPKYFPIPNKQHESIVKASGPMIVAGIMLASFTGILSGFMWNLLLLLLILTHASLRLRNIDNKITNTVGKIARRKTVMSEILNFFPDYYIEIKEE
uniref:Jwa ortholog (inferred by orthology to a D. melanogaster protein) n=1 Tax=Strongyloides venezuelensis TaxID=75913 RepID=A0A0K0FDW4_STRVS